MLFRQSCSWCHHINEIYFRPAFCADCRHRADVSRSECDCPKCQRYGATRYEPDPETRDDLQALAERYSPAPAESEGGEPD